ncbi:MAG: hypothetical protein ACPGO3_09155 [Magnetospiraceae bacterium]
MPIPIRGEAGEANTIQTVINKQMGINHADFLRLLPRALAGRSYQVVDGPIVTVDLDPGSLTINVGPEGKRQIALIVLPTTAVTLTFESVDEDVRTAMLERFDRAYQRGGG